MLDIWSSEAIARETIDTIAEYIQSSFRVMLHSQAEELEEVRNSASKSEPTSSLKTPTSTKSQPQKTTPDQIQVLPKFVLRLPAQNNLTQINLNSFLDSDLGDYLKVEDTLYVLSDLETAIKQAISLV